jgi:hypothetical protein
LKKRITEKRKITDKKKFIAPKGSKKHSSIGKLLFKTRIKLFGKGRYTACKRISKGSNFCRIIRAHDAPDWQMDGNREFQSITIR